MKSKKLVQALLDQKRVVDTLIQEDKQKGKDNMYLSGWSKGISEALEIINNMNQQ